jgi:hypothetical protein
MGRIVWRAFLAAVVAASAGVMFAPAHLDLRWVAPTFGAACVAVLAAGVRIHRLDRSLAWHVGRPEAWTLLGAGLASLVVADAARVAWSGPAGPVYPSAADAVMLPGYGAAVVGLIILIRVRAPGRALDCTLLAGIGTLAVAFPAWVLWFGPAGSGATTGGTSVLALLWLSLDLFLLLLTSRLMLLSDEHPAAYSYLLLSMGALLTIHCIIAINALEGVRMAYAGLEGPFIVVYGLWALAASTPRWARCSSR